LISMARISGGELVREPVNLSKLSEEIVAELKYQDRQQVRHQDREREVKCMIAHGMRVEGDRTLLRMVLENLIGNAWKFSSKVSMAEIEIGVDNHQTDAEGQDVFFIRDNGAGFDMRYADRLFGVFQRLHGNGEFQGTGIGLATVARILQRHGGRVWADAAVGVGATFFFTLWDKDHKDLRREKPAFTALPTAANDG
jgi:light-regulated signal transduction histidine kinase (bacteriophytochrome)